MKTLKLQKIRYNQGVEATRIRQCVTYAEFLRQHDIRTVYLPPRAKNERNLANLWRRQLLAALLGFPNERDWRLYERDTVRQHHTRMQVRLEDEGFVFVDWELECEEVTS